MPYGALVRCPLRKGSKGTSPQLTCGNEIGLKVCACVVCAAPAELARQLLEAGAPVTGPEEGHFLQPLHLACMGQVRSTQQVTMRDTFLVRFLLLCRV